MQKNRKMTVEKSQKDGQILEVGVNSTSLTRVLAGIRANLSKNNKFFIITPNPEIVLASKKDKEYQNILNSADISVPDGIGLVHAHAFLSLKAPKNKILSLVVFLFQGLWVGISTFLNRKWLFKNLKPIKGRELFMELIKLGNKKKWRVFFLGGLDDESQKTKEILEKSFKSIKMESHKGPKLNNKGLPISKEDQLIQKDVIEKINKFSPHLLFVAFGAPKQEKWVFKNMTKLKIGGVMVVGGAFRYLTGKAILPPTLIEKYGLEWVWRLFTEPKRIIRIVKASIIFPIAVFKHKLVQNTP